MVYKYFAVGPGVDEYNLIHVELGLPVHEVV